MTLEPAPTGTVAQDATVDPDHVAVPDELAEVRAGEQLDWAALERYLRAELGDELDADGPFQVLQFPNGSANLTYRVSLGDLQLVVRRPPFGELAPGAHDMRREYRALSTLWRHYPRAPRAYALCTDHDVVGSDFVVMEYRRGTVVWRAIPDEMAHLDDAGRRIGFATVDALADLHAVDPAAAELSSLGRPDGFLERQLGGWTSRWETVAPGGDDHPVSRLGTVLTAARPDSPPAAVLHNDFKVDNCQFAPDDPDVVTAVFDWDMATLGDPLVDLGTMLNYWPDPADDPDVPSAVPGTRALGLPSRAEVVERYAARSGADLDDIAWYVAFGCWRTAIIMQQLYARHLRGETTDERMAQRGAQVPDLGRRGLELLATSTL
ncbi:phosphotransferase family protein [Nitriliruptoraceae bacterium ZYF776]|nr:phosphotransferase family protein [Profundirhabdus halotolerans]